MNRHGVALLATLWLLAALSVVTASALTMARVARRASLNAIALTRGRWAAEGCLAILQADASAGQPLVDVDSLDLGAGLWCRARVEDADARVTLGKATPEMLDRLFGDHRLTSAFLDWTDPDDDPRSGGAEAEWYVAAGRRLPRNAPVESMDELADIAGFDSALVDSIRPRAGIHGSGRVDVNTASEAVLRTIPGFEPATVPLVLRRREGGGRWRDLDDLLLGLPPNLRAPLAERYAELQGLLGFRVERVEIHLEGHVSESSLIVAPLVIAAPVSGRLAILAREAW